MNPIRSFVVRIYRQERREIAGVVEDVQSGKTAFFASFSALRSVLAARRRERPALRTNRPSTPTSDA